MTACTRTVLAVSLFLSGGAPAQAAWYDEWVNGARGYEQALREHEQTGRPMAVYFYTDWCPYCRALENGVLSSRPVRKALRHFLKVRVNPERSGADRKLAAQFGVGGYPTFYILPAGSSQRRSVGNYTDPDYFAQQCFDAGGMLNQPPGGPSSGPGDEPEEEGAGWITVVLKDGTSKVGQLVLEDEREMVLMNNGQLVAIDRATIERVVHGWTTP